MGGADLTEGYTVWYTAVLSATHEWCGVGKKRSKAFFSCLLALFCFKLILQGFILGGYCRGEEGIQRDRVVSGIGVHDINEIPKEPGKNYVVKRKSDSDQM